MNAPSTSPNRGRLRFAFTVTDPSAAPTAIACGKSLEKLGFDTFISEASDDVKRSHNPAPAALLLIESDAGKSKYVVEAKERLTTETIGLAIAKAKLWHELTGERALLISIYINDRLGDRLQQEGIDYIDSAGNAHLTAPPLYLWLRGGKPEKRPERITRAFQSSGLQLIALLLAHPEAVNWPYRKLAERAGVSLGSVSHIFGDLRHAGHLVLTSPREKALINRSALCEKWEFGYAARLRPSLNPQVFRLADRADIRSLPDRIAASVPPGDALIGGELGASLLLGHLRPERVTLHVPPHRDRLPVLTALRLIPDRQGTIELVDQFGAAKIWQWQHQQGGTIAHPLLIYAELRRNAADDRVRETAQLVFDRYLAPVFDDESAHQRR